MSTNQPIFHYKSHLTKKKLNDYKSRSIDHFELDNIEEFEKQFQKYQESFRQKQFPEQAIQSSTSSQIQSNNNNNYNNNDKIQTKQTIKPSKIQRFASSGSLNNIIINNNNTNKNQKQINGILKNQDHIMKSNPKITSINVDDYSSMPQIISTSTQHQNINHKKEQQPMNGLIDSRFKLILKQNANNKENPVVNYFGNSLIATVFTSLIIKTMEDKFSIKINMDCDIPISSNVLKMFDLSTVVINNMKTMNEKKEYIYSTMCKKIDTLLENFDEKVKQRDAIIEKQEMDEKKKQLSHSNDDQFYWLKLKASHDTLRKKLRQQIIEKLSEYENLILIDEDIKNKQELKQQDKHDEANKVQTNLKNLQYTSTKEVFKNMSTYGSHKIQQYLSRLGIVKYPHDNNTTSKTNKRRRSEDQINITEQQQSNNIINSHQRTSSTNLINSTINNNNNNNKLNLMIKTDSLDDNEQNKFWSQQRENLFQKQRSEKKYIYSNEVVASNWNDVGFLPFVQKYILEYKKSIHRDALLDRYKNGEQLSESEYKFLANTSELLNSCVDKNFMQKAVNIVNPDLLENMELGLAEQILCNYEDAKLAIKRSRQNFLKEKQQKQQEWLQDQYEKVDKQRKKIYNANFYRRYYKMFSGILERMEREQKFADKLPENIHGAEYLNDYLLGKASEKESIQKIYKIGKLTDFEFKSYLEKKKQQIKEKEEQNHQSKRFKSLSKPISYTSDEFVKNIKRRQYHPSSKIFIEKHHFSESDDDHHLLKDLTIEQQEKIRYNKDKKLEIKQNEISKYELNLKSIDILRDQKNFKTFYSGGPPKQQQQLSIYERFRQTGKNSATQQEMNSIRIIQKRIRAFLKRKLLIQQMRNMKIQKDYKYKHIIDQIQMNPNQIHLKLNDTYNPMKPSIDDLSLILSKQKQSVLANQRQSFLNSMTRSNSCYSSKGIDRSFSQHNSKNTFQNTNNNEQKSPLNEIIRTPQHGNKTPSNNNNNNNNNDRQTPLNRSLSRGSKCKQQNQDLFSQNPYVKIQEDLSDKHKQLLNITSPDNYFDRTCWSSFHQTPKILSQQQDGKSTQVSVSKQDDHHNSQLNTSSGLKQQQQKEIFNHSQQYQQNRQNSNILLNGNKMKIEYSEEDENETGDKFDDYDDNGTSAQKSTYPSPFKKINQQTYNNNLYQQKRTSLLFKIPSSAVKINKYIDTKNISQQFALKEFLLPKTPKENLLMNSKKMIEKHPTKIAQAFENNHNNNIKQQEIKNNFDKQSSLMNSTHNISSPSTMISQFLFQSPSTTSMQQIKFPQSDSHFGSQNNLQINCQQNQNNIKNISSNNILQPSSPTRSIQNSHVYDNDDNSSDIIQSENNNNNVIIPNMKELEPPENIPQPTIKQQRLLAAAANNKLQMISNSGFIFYEHDVNARDKYGNTPLHIAAKNNHFEFLSWLISKKAHTNLRNKNGWTPLHFAFSQNKIDGVIILTTAGGDLNILNNKGQTPLALGSSKLLQKLNLEKGISIVRDEEMIQEGYLKSFNNNILLGKRNKMNEFVPQNAEFQMKPLYNPTQNIIKDNQINSFEQQL